MQIIAGSVEYIDATVTCDVTLDTQAVAMAVVAAGAAIAPADWVTAAWTGVAGTTRTCQRLTTGTEAVGHYSVYVKITDSPEIPIVRAGALVVM